MNGRPLPSAASTVALTLFVDGADDPAERHHLDFAETDQPGPLWHLQAGGNPPGYAKFETTGSRSHAGRSHLRTLSWRVRSCL